MRTQLVTIPTDTAPLEGALHEPDSGKAAGAVLLFHGNTMNFYVSAPRVARARSRSFPTATTSTMAERAM